MRKIMEEYGEFLLAALIAGILFTFFFGAGGAKNVRTISADVIAEQTGAYLAAYDSAAFDAYAGTGTLLIEYVNDPVIAGIRTPAADHFRAASGNEGQAEITVCMIRDSQGQTYHTQIEEGKEYLYLENAGIYTVCLRAEDSCGRQRYALLKIPVQRQ